ncbi:MAG: carboxypeptidase regulatory-like domain-containing protein [Bacteroidales bacterium]|nr:carboxypeptidase regulatory-like domain-containing protein [Bacteroidales bacterium]
MKRFTLLLTVVFISIAAFGQSYDIDPQDYEKLQRIKLEEREAAKAEVNQQDSPKFIEGTPSNAKAIECLEDATYSNPPVNFTSGVTSNSDVGYEAAQKIEGFDDPIQAIRFFGIQGIFSDGWTPMNDVDPYDFEINFYEDNAGLPGTLISSIDATLNHVNTGELFAGVYNVYHWDFIPSSPVGGLPSTFWVGVANTNANAWFLWIDQPGGPGAAAQANQGVWAITTYDSFGICLVPVLAEDDAPAAPSDFSVSAGAMGALSAELAWTNPALTFSGETLTELDEIKITRNGELIHTITDPVIGAAATYTDNTVPAAGTYSYGVFGVNTVGDGPAVSASIYIGEDVPAAPGDITLVADGNNGHVSWTAPTEGLNGGYLSGVGLTYTVVRMPGNVEVADDITATEFLDTTVPGIGNYFYTVTASNDIGVGGTGQSNIALLSAEGVLMYETFDYPVNALPPGWTVTGVAHAWSVFNSSNAGGTAPELRLSWTPAATGMSRLVTYPVDIEDYTELRLKFRQYLNNFSTNEGEIVAIDVSFDGGETWDDIWEVVITDDVPVGEYELFFDVPAGKSTMHFGFRFEGNSFNINYWYIDNIILEPVVENDLVALSVTGNSTPSAGVETMYNIAVQNAGTATQTDYTVKLMQQGGIEIGSVDGTAIEFGETLTFQIPWTPGVDDDGPTYLYGVVELDGDEVPGNNQTPNLNVVVQPGDILVVTIGTETTSGFRRPFDFWYNNSLTQNIYYPEEIGLGGGVLTGVSYYNNFTQNLNGQQIRIYAGVTDKEDLTEGFISDDIFTLVFEGAVDFPQGQNEVFIPFAVPFPYGGGNLVIMTNKTFYPYEGASTDVFFNTNTPAKPARQRTAISDGETYDPLNPPSTGANVAYVANTSLYFSLAGLGSLEGNVTDGTDPIEGVRVQILGMPVHAMTDADGDYEFPALLTDTYNIEFSKFGYETVVIEGVVIEEDVVTVQNAVVPALNQFTVSGVVQGNDGALIEDAQISMVGYDTYAAVTDASGAFSIADVFGGTYELTVMAPGYEVYVDDAVVVDADTDLGTIEVVEIIFPPYGLVIETEGLEPGSALFTWNEADLLMLYQHDGAIPANPNAFYQVDSNVYGTIFDLSSYPDAVVSHIDFHHLQWGIPNDNYDFLVHIVDWANFEVIETIGPLTTAVNDDWEEEVMLGMVNVAGYDQVGILIQPQGYIPTDAYPCITTDATGPSGLSISAPFNNLSGYTVNGPTVGDFFINLWISTAFGGDKIVKAEGLVSDNLEPVETRNGISIPSSEVTLTQNFWEMMPANKVFEGFNVFLNDVEVASGITGTQYLFTGLPGGSHVAGVQSVYTTGVSEIVTINFQVEGPEFARAQIIHNSADAAVANVDIYVNGELVLENVGFRQATPFIDIVAGVTLQLHVAPAGAGFGNAVGPIEVMFTPGETYVVIANGIVSDTGYDPAEPFGLYVFGQGQEEAGSAANTDLLVFHGATDAPEVSVWAMGIDNALFAFEYGEFAPNGYLPLPTNDYVIEIRDASGATTIVAYEAPLATLNLDGEALVVVASGFLNPANNSNGPDFGLWVATTAGGNLIELPVYVSVQDITMGQGNISMFPNPSTDMVNLRSTSAMQEVRVVDISGRMVYTQAIDADQHQINVRQFESGIYFVQVLTAEGTFVGKLQIQK